MVAAFVDMVGLLMVVPLLPFYTVELGGSETMVGVLVSSYALAQLVSAPLWGKVSDRYGRRPALIVGLAFSAAAYVVFSFSETVWMLLASRLVQGAGGGTTGVIQAYVADASEPENRARSLGWISAATNLGVAVGPVLGSLSVGLGREAPGLIAAGLCLLNMVFAARYLRESHDPAAARGEGVQVRRSRDAVLEVLSHPARPVSRLILMYAVPMGAFSGSTAVLALFLAAEHGVTVETIGYFFMYIGLLSVVTRALILGPVVDRVGEARLSRYGMVTLALGLLLLPLTGGWYTLAFAVALLPLGTAFTFPCITALLSRVIGRHERGLYMGVQQTYGGISRVIAPVAAAWAFENLGHGVPFQLAAAIVAITVLLGFRIQSRPANAPPPAATPV